MSYKRQDIAAKQLQHESMKALDALEMRYWNQVQKDWTTTRVDLRSFIVNVYHHFFGNETWDVAHMNGTGCGTIMAKGIHERLQRFKVVSMAHAKFGINDIYKESVLRHCWVLDQTSPPSFKVRIPHKLRLFEASAVHVWAGPAARTIWTERWGSWVDAYEASLNHNIKLGAINSSSALDAAQEVDATRSGTPSSGLLDSLQRVYSFESVWAMNDAIGVVSEVNEEMEVEEIWQTRDDNDVDEDCADNEGLDREEADGEIPLHPNCRCYWRIVPRSWASMLRDGDEDERDTALAMDSEGIVPNAMAVTDKDGNIAGHLIVSFQKWKENMGMAVGTER